MENFDKRVPKQFHAKTVNLAKLIQHSVTSDSLEENIDTLHTYYSKNSLDNFMTWFDHQYLNDDWIESWIDIDRPPCEGLFNTNDFTEAMLKQLVPIMTTTSVANLVTVLVETVFPYYE